MAALPLKLEMTPATGERRLRFVGDRIRFTLRSADGKALPGEWRGLLRTNLGRGQVLRNEIITSRGDEKPMTGASWRDVPMQREGDQWFIELTLTEVGYFKAKAYAVDERGFQFWPDGPNAGLSVHPSSYRTANTIYCAFTRLFGETKTAVTTANRQLEAQLKQLDKLGFAVIPPSGKLRDVAKALPHIIDTLGCRILHLLPVNPTPTAYARFGRFGSPYAGLDLTAIDPALVEFDRRTTAVDQFRELTCAVHAHEARLFLDLVINHTGWSSTLHEEHPQWFLRKPDGAFVSPGAWGVTWEDLVELDPENRELWDRLAAAFLTWCRRGVDGFRCDAGYKVPMPVWQFITARVREEFPETIFLLEGLGGAWNDTEALLTEGGMQWAYSELFQEFSGTQIAGYLDHALKQSQRVGVLAHYSETHDNDRLAKKGRVWSLLRNRLCALTSLSGGFGFTCGVEWLASERILVHDCTGLSWGTEENIVPELARLNRLLAGHPCFFDGAKLTRLSAADSPVFVLQRVSADGKDSVVVLVNTDVEKPNTFLFERDQLQRSIGISEKPCVDLLGQSPPKTKRAADGEVVFMLEPGACHCLSQTATPQSPGGDAYRRARAQAAFAISAISRVLEPEEIGPHDWRALAELVERDPKAFLAGPNYLDRAAARKDLLAALNTASLQKKFRAVVEWSLTDCRRVTLVPPGHWFLIRDQAPFRATLRCDTEGHVRHVESISVRDGHVAFFPPCPTACDAELALERYAEEDREVRAVARFLPALPEAPKSEFGNPKSETVLLTNGLGGMARLCVDLGRVNSKYDCLLGANLNSRVPVDRHIFAKRVRVWVNTNGFISPLNADNLVAFDAGPPARWCFAANAGDGNTVEIEMMAEMVEGQNTTELQFSRGRGGPLGRPDGAARRPHPFPNVAGGDAEPVPHVEVRLTVRIDIEDRNFHWETKRTAESEHHFADNTHPLTDKPGFELTPAADRQLRVFSDTGVFNAEPEWCENIPHPVEASRGQAVSGDAYSPGWFDLPLSSGDAMKLVVTAEPKREKAGRATFELERKTTGGEFGERLLAATRAFVVRRGEGRTIIAGYPWFLDWGRDTLICARGLLAAGMIEEVRQILLTFARLEQNGTLPNTIHGDDASNRDTSDAPLWFGIACEDTAALIGGEFHSTRVSANDRTIAEVFRSIAVGYLCGTANGIRVDAESGLVWSPSHFTWMDTNFPAGTPREGYPIEIQVLWIRLLRQLERIGAKPEGEPWGELAARAETSLQKLFWLENRGWFADSLIAKAGQPARTATPDTALRSNYLFVVSFGLASSERARRCVEAALKYLVVPGALRSLAPMPVSPPLPIYGDDKHLLNDPSEPYWGRYEGDEDTRRKPAYHNGTAWTWMFPVFCEALARAWDWSPEAVAAAKAYLGSMARLLDEGCLGQIPEILDGDAPHQQRGCDAQAWSATEVLRVWKLLNKRPTA